MKSQPVTTPTPEATYERARRRANIAIWTAALQRRRIRSEEPEDEEFIFRRWADIDFFIVCLTRLRRAAVLAASVPAIREQIRAALEEFDTQLPHLKTMRDVAEHFDDYALDRGKQKTIRRQQLEVGSLGDKSFEWLDRKLDFDAAFHAGERLFEAIRQAQPAIIAAQANQN